MICRFQKNGIILALDNFKLEGKRTRLTSTSEAERSSCRETVTCDASLAYHGRHLTDYGMKLADLLSRKPAVWFLLPSAGSSGQYRRWTCTVGFVLLIEKCANRTGLEWSSYDRSQIKPCPCSHCIAWCKYSYLNSNMLWFIFDLLSTFLMLKRKVNYLRLDTIW